MKCQSRLLNKNYNYQYSLSLSDKAPVFKQLFIFSFFFIVTYLSSQTGSLRSTEFGAAIIITAPETFRVAKLRDTIVAATHQ